MSLDGSGASRAAGEGMHNEDAFLVEQGLGLYIVCDGASDSPAGEIASRTATRALREFVSSVDSELDLRDERVARAVVQEAMRYAINAVEEDERENPEHRGLATTVTMLLAHGGVGVVGHRGDSRVYLIRRRRAHQLTVDHELTEHAGEAGDAGEAEDAESGSAGFDIFSLDLLPGDTIVLCSDGAEQVVQDETIARSAGDVAPRVLASRIVSAAYRGSPDQDSTAVVIRVRGDREPGWLEQSVPIKGTTVAQTIDFRDRVEPE